MKYRVCYSGVTHPGKKRRINQDNFICDGMIMPLQHGRDKYAFSGCFIQGQVSLAGVFDGLGGEECGEVASYIAAQCARNAVYIGNSKKDLEKLCSITNEKICDYSAQNNISSMGTTAALLEFTKNEIGLCNIGDSKIFRISEKKMEQLSKDHLTVAPYGMKPPLSQNLGIPVSDMVIEPYFSKERYQKGDIYLICSDGLTDMLMPDKILKIMQDCAFDRMAEELLEQALEAGGKDNITIILCRIEGKSVWDMLKNSKKWLG